MILTMNNAWNLMDEVFNHPQRETRNMKVEDDIMQESVKKLHPKNNCFSINFQGV